MIEPTATAVRPNEAAKMIGVSIRKLRHLYVSGELAHARSGRCVLIPVAAISDYLQQRMQVKTN